MGERTRRTSAPLRLLAYTEAVEIGGAELSLATLLAGLRADVDVTVVGIELGVVSRLADARPGTRARLVPRVRHKGDVRAIGALVRTFRASRPDIVHANLFTPWTGLYGIVAALLTPGARAIAVEHLPAPTTSATQRRLKRMLSKRLAAHVAVGRRSARLVESYVGLPAGSVLTIYNGVADDGSRPRGRTGGPLVIGSIGRLTDQKGYDVLVRALPDLADAEAVVIGEGPERPALEALAARTGVSDRFRLPGADPCARARLHELDVFVLPSRAEALPLAIVEAMLAGLPVVATDVGSVAEVVAPGATGLLVAPEDPAALAAALRRLAGDPEEAAAMGRRGRRRALEEFSAAQMVAAYERLYDAVRR